MLSLCVEILISEKLLKYVPADHLNQRLPFFGADPSIQKKAFPL